SHGRVGLLRRGADDRWSPAAFPGEAALAQSATFSADGKQLCLVNGNNIEIRSWPDGKVIRTIESPGACNEAAFSPDGKLLVESGIDGDVRLWHLASGAKVFQETIRRAEYESKSGNKGSFSSPPPVAFSADGKTLVGYGYGFIKFDEQENLVTVDGSRLHFWEVATGKARRRLDLRKGHFPGDPGSNTRCVPAPDGRTFAFATNTTIHLCDHFSMEERLRIGGSRVAAWTVVFTPDGTRVLAGTADGTFCVWDASSGKLLAELGGHQDAVSLQLSLDGNTIASRGSEGTVLLWNVRSLQGTSLPAPRPDASVDQLWAELAQDGDAVLDARRNLALRPEEVMQVLEKQLQPVPVTNPGEVRILLERLRSRDTATWKDAARQLVRLGESAHEAVDKELEDDSEQSFIPAAERTGRPMPVEIRRRLEWVSDLGRRWAESPTAKRYFRALDLLEEIDTPRARTLLQKIAAGEPGSELTQCARAALGRLEGRQRPMRQP
ncbi:MAG: WD40 repeat domain-containing protein, partial [Gemmataceae bacterium]